jgi:hypothetical protein
MRNLFNSRKRIAVVAAGAAVLLGGVTAVAYWTSTGTGSGAASTTAGTNSFSFTQAPLALSAMYPGDSAQSFAVTVKNTSTTQSEYVTHVAVYVTTSNAGCTGADFLLNGSPAPSSSGSAVDLAWTGVDLAHGASQATAGTDTLQFNDTGSIQDACKSATVTLNYVAS